MNRRLTRSCALMRATALSVAVPAHAQEGSAQGIKVQGRWTIDVTPNQVVHVTVVFSFS